MKKYMVMVMVFAISGVFVGCHEEEFGTPFIEQKKALFEETFIKAFGQPDSTHNWGFRMREDVTRTENANANEWADPDKAYGGLRVPPPLTDEQIAVVKKYFQTHPNLGYEDPHWTNYFMQQVYKGHTDVPEGCATPEAYKAANGTTDIIASDHMDHLAAIDGSFIDHINNFNHGDCSNNDDVLDNGGNANDGPFHSDKIMYMKESTTKSFGYYNSNGSVCRTEYTGLVSYKTIMKAMGAEADCLNDGWERSFMGFDFEQMVDDEVYAVELDYSAGWSADLPHHFPVIGYKWYEFKGKKYHMLSSEQNRYCGIFYKKADGQDLNDADINDDLIESLLDAGYLPVDGGANKKWVKVGGCADGYYSDWIVCLTEAKSAPKAPEVWEVGQNGNPEPRYVVEGRKVVESGRVMCEDLAGATGKFDDMDYNDVVFDAVIVNEYKKLVTEDDEDIIDNSFDAYDKTYATVRLMAAGGTIPVDLTIKDKNGKKYTFDVHETLDAPDNVMINTLSENEDNSYLGGATVVSRDPVTLKNDKGLEQFDSVEYISDITLTVQYENVSAELETKYGGATYKFLVPLGVKWARERSSFGQVYPDFKGWVHNKDSNIIWYNTYIPELLYDEGLEGLTEPEEYETKEWYDDNGGSSSAYKTLQSTNSPMVFPNTASETVLFDFTQSGAGYLCPEITTASGKQDEEYVSIPGSSSIDVNDIIRIYGVYLSDWYIETNFSDKITSDNGKGYIDIPVASNYINNINSNNWSRISITGKHFTVTYITLRSGD